MNINKLVECDGESGVARENGREAGGSGSESLSAALRQRASILPSILTVIQRIHMENSEMLMHIASSRRLFPTRALPIKGNACVRSYQLPAAADRFQTRCAGSAATRADNMRAARAIIRDFIKNESFRRPLASRVPAAMLVYGNEAEVSTYLAFKYSESELRGLFRFGDSGSKKMFR